MFIIYSQREDRAVLPVPQAPCPPARRPAAPTSWPDIVEVVSAYVSGLVDCEPFLSHDSILDEFATAEEV